MALFEETGFCRADLKPIPVFDFELERKEDGLWVSASTGHKPVKQATGIANKANS